MNEITRDTRRESYLLRPTPRQKEIIDVLRGKEMTAREIAYALGFSERNAVAPRLTEMEKIGHVKVVGTRLDKGTKRRVAVYSIM